MASEPVRAELAGLGVIEFGRGEDGAVGASGDHYAAVGQQRRGAELVGGSHRAGGREVPAFGSNTSAEASPPTMSTRPSESSDAAWMIRGQSQRGGRRERAGLWDRTTPPRRRFRRSRRGRRGAPLRCGSVERQPSSRWR